eukprot:FR736391.1.p1 GENE.FR736391.1~~FR736391.1.p1  ORF type:complete len:236 (+),score=25.42 FR736391.1:160-867(+)
MIITGEMIDFYTEVLTLENQRTCIRFIKAWRERSRRINHAKMSDAWRKWGIFVELLVKEDSIRRRSDLAMETLRLQSPGCRNPEHIKAISEWLVKDRIIQGVASLPNFSVQKLCQDIVLQTLEKNTMMFCQGQEGQEFIVILHGAVDLFIQFSKRKELNVLWCHSQDYFEKFPTHEVRRDYLGGYLGQLLMTLNTPKTEFGEKSLLSKEGGRNTSAVTSENTTLLLIPQALYKSL